MKAIFYGYGSREIKTWSCTRCNNFHTCGMDSTVDESRRKHEAVCPGVAATPAGYHQREIPRGIFGEISKIREELEELEDAAEQGVGIMVGCELSDLYGALRAYADSLGYRMADLEKMADVSKRVFESGHRKSRD